MMMFVSLCNELIAQYEVYYCLHHYCRVVKYCVGCISFNHVYLVCGLALLFVLYQAMEFLWDLLPYTWKLLLIIFIWHLLRRATNIAPKKPFLTNILDTLLVIPYTFRLGPWGRPNDISEAVVQAIKSTGLSAFACTTASTKQKQQQQKDDTDKASFIERYSIARQWGLQRSKAKYSPTGYVLALNTLQRRMEDRLRIVDYMNKHPEVRDVKIKPPIFAVGFPRTGTTFLHELLGLHPGVRMHYTWEQMSPVPLTNDTSIEALSKDRKTRYLSNKSRMQFFLALAGDSIQNIHRVGYDEPEECTTPLASDLPWSIPEIGFITYAAEEVNKLGAGNAFEKYYEYLQLLTFQAKERRNIDFTWMLKCPFHLPYLAELYEAFPGSTVVWTHRNPCECIASACSLYEAIMAFTMEPNSIDKAALGRAVLNYTKQALLKAFETLKRGKVNIIHIKYKDTIKSPKTVTEQIYKQTGIDYTKEYDYRLDEYLKENEAKRELARSKNVKKEMHTYNLIDYGLTKSLVQKEFQDYINDYC